MTDDVLTRFVRALVSGAHGELTDLGPAAHAQLTRFCRGYLADPESSEDAAQEILSRAARTVGPRASPRAWLLTIARHHCLDRLRARAASIDGDRLATNFDIASEAAGPLTKLVGAEREDELTRALAVLSDDERELLRLRYVENLSRAEVAELLGITEELVKSRVYETIERLRRRMRTER